MNKIILLATAFIFKSSICLASETSSIQTEAADDSTATVESAAVIVDKAWARKSMSSNNNSAAYMSINNKTDKDIVIIGASSIEVANNVELHNSFVDEKGISRMTHVDKIVVPAKSAIELKPGSLHIMLFDLRKSLNSGDKFLIELKVDGSDPLTVETTVE